MKRVLVAVVVVLACSKSKTNELPAEAWTEADYAAVGLVVDKPWSPDDHAHAAQVLAQQTAGHRERLPRYQGAKSGRVFAKLIERLPADDARPIGERFGARNTRFQATNAISKLYMDVALAAPPREYIELAGALLREAVVLETGADDLIASFGPDDPSREVRLGGLAKMRAGFSTMLLGGFLVAGDLRVPETDRVALVEHMMLAMPVLLPKAPDDTQAQIRDQIARLAANLPAGPLRDRVRSAQAIATPK